MAPSFRIQSWAMSDLVSPNFDRTSGQVAAHLLRDRILSGELAPGSRLNQADLANEFGMSRIPIRDALRLLANEGLVALRAHATAVVTPMSADELRDLYEIRLALEPRLSSAALPQLTSEDIEEMERVLAAMGEAESAGAWLEGNNRFHEIMYASGTRKRSAEIVRRVRQQTDRYTRVHLGMNNEVGRIEHEMILEAAREGQGRRLEALIFAHLATALDIMLSYLNSPEAKTVEALGSVWDAR